MFRKTLFFFLVVGVTISAFAQVEPADTGKMSWDLFQQVVSGQRTRAEGGGTQTVTAFLITSSPVTEDRILALKELGYTVLGVFGNFVLVRASADLYTKPNVGINSIAFVSNATLPVQAIPNTSNAIMIQNPSERPAPYDCTGLMFTSGDDPDNSKLDSCLFR
jgi:hypothetical protein